MAVGNAEFARGTVARHMRCSMDSDARVANEQSQEDNEANVATGRIHARFDRLAELSSERR